MCISVYTYILDEKEYAFYITVMKEHYSFKQFYSFPKIFLSFSEKVFCFFNIDNVSSFKFLTGLCYTQLQAKVEEYHTIYLVLTIGREYSTVCGTVVERYHNNEFMNLNKCSTTGDADLVE